MAKPKRGSVVLLAGTRKGAFIFRSSARRKKWSLEGPHFPGLNVHHFILNPRDHEGCLAVYRSANAGRSWQKRTRGLPTRNAHLTILRQAMFTDTFEPVGLYFGTEAGQVFDSCAARARWQLLADCLPPILTVEAAVV